MAEAAAETRDLETGAPAYKKNSTEKERGGAVKEKQRAEMPNQAVKGILELYQLQLSKNEKVCAGDQHTTKEPKICSLSSEEKALPLYW